MTSKNNATSVEFKLRNTRNKAYSGRIMIAALREEELRKTISLDRKKTRPFIIKRFRSFSKEFVHSSANPYRVIAIIVWNLNHKKFLEQHYWIE